MSNRQIGMLVIMAIAIGYSVGRLTYAHVCTVTACNEKLDCAPYRNTVLTMDDLYDGKTQLGFMESGKFGSMKTYLTLAKINPYDWDKNEYFTGSGWSKDKDKAMKATTQCEINNAYLHWKSK